MASLLDMYDPWIGYRYRPSSGETLPPQQQQEVFRYQGGQPVPIQPAAGDPYDPLREYTGISDLQRGFKAAGEGDYWPAAGYGALGAASLASMVPMGAFGMMARGVRRGGTALDALNASLDATRPARSALDAAIDATQARGTLDAVIDATKTRSERELAYNAAEPRFSQYATSYPPLGEPIMRSEMKLNKKTGQEFEKTWAERNMTPQGQALMDERNRIQKDMDRYGYEPYYKTEERYYVDPSNYPPPNVDTGTLGPKTLDKISEYMAKINAPETTAALRMAIDKGIEMGTAEHWYAVGQLEHDFVKEFGPELGRQRFLDTFAAPMGATTSGNRPTPNLMMAHYLEYLRQNNMPMPTHGSMVPAPMFGQRMTNNLEDYARMRAAGGYAGMGADQPKMHNFTRSYIGDLSQPVMDKVMAEGMLAHVDDPKFPDRTRTNAFGLLQQPVMREAELRGVQPGNLQDVAWGGFRGESRPFIQDINDSIERTHRLTGMPREEIVRRGLIRKEIPLYGLLGTLGLGAAAGGGEY